MSAARHKRFFSIRHVPSQLMALLRACAAYAKFVLDANVVLIRSGSLFILRCYQKKTTNPQLNKSPISGRASARCAADGIQRFDVFCPWEWKRELDVWAHATVTWICSGRVKKSFRSTALSLVDDFSGHLIP